MNRKCMAIITKEGQKENGKLMRNALRTRVQSIRCACLLVCRRALSKVIRIHLLRQLMHIDSTVRPIHIRPTITARLHFDPLIYWAFLPSHNYIHYAYSYACATLPPPFWFVIIFFPILHLS